MSLFKKTKKVTSQPVVNKPSLVIKKQYNFVQAKNFRGFKRFKLSTSYMSRTVEENQATLRKEGFDFTGKQIDLVFALYDDIDELLIVYVDGLQIGTRNLCDREVEVYKAMQDERLDRAYVRIDDTEYGTETYLFLHWEEK